jgi:hypothetical protein
MAYTNQNIIDAYKQAMAGGASEADFVSKAQSMGISNDQLASARSQMMGTTTQTSTTTAPSYTPAPTPTTKTTTTGFTPISTTTTGSTKATTTPTFNLASVAGTTGAQPDYMGRTFTQESINAAKAWAVGKPLTEVLAKASSMGLTPDQLGLVLGSSGQQVTSLTGYGQGASGFNADGGLNYQWGWNSDPSKPSNGQTFANPTTVIGLPSTPGASSAVNLNNFTVGANGITSTAPNVTVSGVGTVPIAPAPAPTPAPVATPTPAPVAETPIQRIRRQQQEEANAAYAAERQRNPNQTDAQIYATMQRDYGVSQDQFNAAVAAAGGRPTAPPTTAPAPTPAPTPAPAPAAQQQYTTQNIVDAYMQSVGAGQATEADFVARAKAMGITDAQLAAAQAQIRGTATTAPTPTPSAGTGTTAGTGTSTSTTGGQFTTKDIIDAYKQATSSGITEAQFVAYAKAQGITDQQLAIARQGILNSTITGGTTPTVTAGQTQPSFNLQSFSNQNLIDAYRQAVGGGMTEAQFVAQAKAMGVSDIQLSAARQQMIDEDAYKQSTNTLMTQQQQQLAGLQAQLKAAQDAAAAAKQTASGKYTAQNIADAYRQAMAGGATEADFVARAKSMGITDDELRAAQALVLGTSSTSSGQVAPPPAVAQTAKPTTGMNLSQIQSAKPWEVAKNQTVAGQIEQIIAADSPLMQQARMRAMQASNQRGLLNSSMAASAGESALYDAAMPIAQQDAGTFAQAAQFNTDATNTFARDSNAFTRDAFMADFNLAANEWAKQQDQMRTYEKMGYEQRLSLDRDAILNGYQNARDAILNGYTVARDATNNAFTLQRDANQNAFTATQNQLEREAAMARVAAGQTADTSLERTAAQIRADQDRVQASTQSAARDTITNARSNLTTQLTNIRGTSGLSTEIKDQMVLEAINSYNTIVAGRSTEAGWDAGSWSYKITSAPAAAPTPATNVVQNVTQGGDGA